MIPYEIYKIVHVFGLICVFSGLASLWGISIFAPLEHHPPTRKALAVLHGVGMTMLLLGGFGMLARLGIAHQGLPGWIYAKLGLWLVLGGSVVLAKRRAKWGSGLLWVWALVGALAAAIAIYKPF